MVPHELRAREVSFPAAGERGIAVVTGTSLGEQRCALRLQQECGSLVRVWFEVGSTDHDPQGTGSEDRWFGWGPPTRRHFSFNPGRLRRLTISAARKIRYRRHRNQRRRNLALAEQRLFGAELQELRWPTQLPATRVAAPDDPALVDAVRGLDPFLLIWSSRALVSPGLLERHRGPALTLHAGWSPTFPASSAVEQALYHRDLNSVGATVHLLTSAGEPGPIVRRSHPSLMPWDNPETCVNRVLALGAELLCEVVRDIVHHPEIVVFDLPPQRGAPYPAVPLDGKMLAMLHSDFSAGWLEAALQQARSF